MARSCSFGSGQTGQEPGPAQALYFASSRSFVGNRCLDEVRDLLPPRGLLRCVEKSTMPSVRSARAHLEARDDLLLVAIDARPHVLDVRAAPTSRDETISRRSAQLT